MFSYPSSQTTFTFPIPPAGDLSHQNSAPQLDDAYSKEPESKDQVADAT